MSEFFGSIDCVEVLKLKIDYFFELYEDSFGFSDEVEFGVAGDKMTLCKGFGVSKDMRCCCEHFVI